jgi:hypothetical protein
MRQGHAMVRRLPHVSCEYMYARLFHGHGWTLREVHPLRTILQRSNNPHSQVKNAFSPNRYQVLDTERETAVRSGVAIAV